MTKNKFRKHTSRFTATPNTREPRAFASTHGSPSNSDETPSDAPSRPTGGNGSPTESSSTRKSVSPTDLSLLSLVAMINWRAEETHAFAKRAANRAAWLFVAVIWLQLLAIVAITILALR